MAEGRIYTSFFNFDTSQIKSYPWWRRLLARLRIWPVYGRGWFTGWPDAVITSASLTIWEDDD